MATCRAEAGLRVPLSIPSWLSSNIAELRRTRRCERLRHKGVTEPGALCTCHKRSDVHPGPWPSPERREQHGTPLHCEACPLFRIHSPGKEREDIGMWLRKNVLHEHECVNIGSPEWKFSSHFNCKYWWHKIGINPVQVLNNYAVSSLACLHGWQGRHKVKQHQMKKHQ